MKVFYKVTEIVNSRNKKPEVSFLYRKEIKDEEEMAFQTWALGIKYLDGCVITIADNNDAEFQAYIKKDLLKVEEEIEDLVKLKEALNTNKID